ncbi:unannotated protein [freshwater metagenome]|uniref:Unannotated protein n=1 Tax=freshwater metagenome TaxID=449393 RepID=A0A6J7AT43_9ZZZZ
MAPRICLNMIVKDESPVIGRCLDSVRPLIDSWVIVDTGSTDGTQDLIRRHFADLPGELHERAWRNFGHNRSEALALARGKADYVLIMDADDELEIRDDVDKAALEADAYDVTFLGGGIEFVRSILLSNRLPWRFEGVLHEYVTADGEYSRGHFPGARVIEHREGARTRGVSGDVKYGRDAVVLEAALLDEPDNARYVFYLAQSYRDSSQPAKALAAYERRARMCGWDEELWYSLYQMAKLSETLELDPAVVIYRYLEAYQNRPTRAEPLADLARFHRIRSEWALAHLFASQSLDIERPADRLFVGSACYDWICLDEYAIACYWIGDHSECQRVCRKLLASPLLPENERERVSANLDHSLRAAQPA